MMGVTATPLGALRGMGERRNARSSSLARDIICPAGVPEHAWITKALDPREKKISEVVVDFLGR